MRVLQYLSCAFVLCTLAVLGCEPSAHLKCVRVPGTAHERKAHRLLGRRLLETDDITVLEERLQKRERQIADLLAVKDEAGLTAEERTLLRNRRRSARWLRRRVDSQSSGSSESTPSDLPAENSSDLPSPEPTEPIPEPSPEPIPEPSPEPIPEPSPEPIPQPPIEPTTDYGGGNCPDGGQAVEATHNTIRAMHNAAPLAWDAALAAQAQAYANTCAFVHSGTPGVGENLMMGFGIGSCSNAVNGWASEVANWAPGSNDWNPAAGHFTQIVWRSTTAVGCGVADCGGRGQFLVCQYNPAGNVIGWFQENVQ